MNAGTNVQVGYPVFNGIYSSPSTTINPPIAVGANYAPYDTTTAAQSYASTTFSGGFSTGSPWFSGAINSTNYIQTSTNGQYVIYNVPSTMTMAYINFAAVVAGGSMQVYGGSSTLLCTVSTLGNAQCVLPVNISGYTQLKIVNVGATYTCIQGIGWTVSPLAVWKSTYALDVSGSVNVSGTITTGNSCSLKYFSITGNTPSAGGNGGYGLPTGCLLANIVAIYGSFIASSGNVFPFNNTYFQYSGDTSCEVSLYVNYSAGVYIHVPSSGTTVGGRPFTAIVVTTA